MRSPKLTAVAIALLGTASLAGIAHAQYQTAVPYQMNVQYQTYVPYPAGARSPSWSYDPYTSGLANCPQRRPSDPPCSETMPPTYGQPNYRGPSPTGWPYTSR